ncbi:hypothetical protein ACH4NF_15225 [Streptomyces sp. NPDC017248]|uniref:hypothetical protein n=1 Tax=unclassified Streptomyces TaxID=2593676 RepID=UPI0037AF044A
MPLRQDTGPPQCSARPLVYACVVGIVGVLALVDSAVPGRVALRVRAVTVATAGE